MRLLVLLIAFIFTNIIAAEEIIVLDKEFQELLRLDIEELTTVSIASKKKKTFQMRPALLRL